MRYYYLLLLILLSISSTACLEGGIKVAEPIGLGDTGGDGEGEPEEPQPYTYSWRTGDWGPCSATQCGTQGVENRSVECVRNDNQVVADSFCIQPRPSLTRSCSARPCNSCTLPWNEVIAHGQSRPAYRTSSVPFGQTCDREIRTCTDGQLSGSFQNQNCSEQGAASCTLPWNEVIAHGQFRPAYRTSSVPFGQTCERENRTCTNGQLSGSFQNQNCSEQSAASCTLPWGQVIPHNGREIAYQAASVAAGQTCNSEERICTNGSLSGSFQNENCSIQNPPEPPAGGIQMDLSYVNMSSTEYTRFKNFVDAAVNGSPGYNFAIADAALMYRLTSQPQYCNLAVQMAERQVATAETAIAGGGKPAVSGDSYLEVGPYISDLALAYDWCSSFVTNAQKTRWANYADQAIYNVWNYNSATWGGRPFPWSGWGVNQPGNNYYYSFVEATMFWGLASNNQSMLNMLRTQKLPALTSYYANIVGGGSMEGTGYGTSHMRLFQLYRVWKDNTNEDLGNSNSHMTDSIRYWVHATVPTLDYFAPIGDQARVSMPTLFDYHRRLMLEARYQTNNSTARDLASWWLTHIDLANMSSGFNYRHDLLPEGSNNTPAAETVFYARGTGNIFARTNWTESATWFNFRAGTYNESHAHQDQGSFTLYRGNWLTATENIYSRSGINQGTDVHNVVRFVNNGTTVRQREGTTSTMTINSTGDNGAVDATANLTPSFGSGAPVTSWQRNVRFQSGVLRVQDSFAMTAGTQAIFQVNVPVQPTVSGNVITAGTLRITVQAPANPTITIVNWRDVNSSEFNSGYRIDITGSTTGYTVELRE